MEISLSVFEGAPFKHFEHTKTFFPQNVFNFFSTFIKNAFDTNSRFVSQKCARNKKERNFGPQNAKRNLIRLNKAIPCTSFHVGSLWPTGQLANTHVSHHGAPPPRCSEPGLGSCRPPVRDRLQARPQEGRGRCWRGSGEPLEEEEDGRGGGGGDGDGDGGDNDDEVSAADDDDDNDGNEYNDDEGGGGDAYYYDGDEDGYGGDYNYDNKLKE